MGVGRIESLCVFLTFHTFGPVSARGFLRHLSASSGGQLATTCGLTTAYRLFMQSSFTGTQASGCQYCLPARMKKVIAPETTWRPKPQLLTTWPVTDLSCVATLAVSPSLQLLLCVSDFLVWTWGYGAWTDGNEKEGRKKEGRACAYLINLHGKYSLGTCHLAVCLWGGYAKS